MNSSLDTIAGLAVGAFLLTVAVRGKTGDMVKLAKRDRAFLQWAVAVGILVYLYNVPELRGAMGYIIVMAFIGLALLSVEKGGNKLFDNAKNFWDFLGGK